MSNITAITEIIAKAARFRKYGQECADEFLAEAVEYGVDYDTANFLMRCARFRGIGDDFEDVVAVHLELGV